VLRSVSSRLEQYIGNHSPGPPWQPTVTSKWRGPPRAQEPTKPPSMLMRPLASARLGRGNRSRFSERMLNRPQRVIFDGPHLQTSRTNATAVAYSSACCQTTRSCERASNSLGFGQVQAHLLGAQVEHGTFESVHKLVRIRSPQAVVASRVIVHSMVGRLAESVPPTQSPHGFFHSHPTPAAMSVNSSETKMAKPPGYNTSVNQPAEKL
jgi:hypothetical protein